MDKLIKPHRLKPGDKIATVSLSWGGAGEPDIRWRYEQGKRRMQEVFGLEVVEMPHTLQTADYVYAHPEKRAEDMMSAFANPDIKGIICCIGGDDSIRMLPYIDFQIIKNHPKIFMGYSDVTVPHLMCFKAGLSSYYGPSVLNDFAENIAMSDYTVRAIQKTLFSGEVIGKIPPSDTFCAQYLEWKDKTINIAREFINNTPYELMQGNGTVRGRLIGGCLEVLNLLCGTPLFPEHSAFEEAILFLETSESHPPDWYIEDFLRKLGANGILAQLSGIFCGKPRSGKLYEEYKVSIRKVLAEYGRSDLPVLYNGSFGHNEPKTVLPYGALAEIDCQTCTFSILESGTE